MINNKGQTLILFIILIPLLLILVAFVVDTGILIKEQNRLKSTTKMAIKESVGDEDKIKELLVKNKIKINNLKITHDGNKTTINNSYKIDSIFGKVIGIMNYKVKANISYEVIDNNIKFIKE